MISRLIDLSGRNCFHPATTENWKATTSTKRIVFARNDPNDTGSPDAAWNQEGGGNKFAENAEYDNLYRRIRQMRVEILEQEMHRPPNADLSPTEFVVQVLSALLHPDDPIPDSGFRVLLRSSTPGWRRLVQRSVGAPDGVGEEAVVSALGSAFSHPRNPYAILVSTDDVEKYELSFPSEILDFEDGTCWLTCRLRKKDNGSPLVSMGWQLIRRPSDGAWLVDRIDWKDFRDEFQPGIGKEEGVHSFS